jgi:hypothetical protein
MSIKVIFCNWCNYATEDVWRAEDMEVSASLFQNISINKHKVREEKTENEKEETDGIKEEKKERKRES